MTTIEQVAEEISAFSKQYDVDNDEQNKSIALNIYNQIDRFADGVEPTAQEIAQFTVAINEHVQVRDLVLGIPKERNIDYVGRWIAHVGNLTPEVYDVPVATIMSSLYYAEGDEDKATYYIDRALKANPNYSLAQLLKRVYESNWGAQGMISMRDELHDKVKAELGI
jgi:tetratricopeptide (TPR) repeat protein